MSALTATQQPQSRISLVVPRARRMLTPTPEVLFDAANLEHRAIFIQFLRFGKWPAGASRFVLDESWTNIPAMIERKMLIHALLQTGELSDVDVQVEFATTTTTQIQVARTAAVVADMRPGAVIAIPRISE